VDRLGERPPDPGGEEFAGPGGARSNLTRSGGRHRRRTLLDAGRYRTALLVSADVASVGIDWEEPGTACLFSDAAAAAAAAVLGRTPPGLGSRVLGSAMATYAEGAHLCEIVAGSRLRGLTREDFLFRMDGPKVFRLARRTLPRLLDRVLADAGLAVRDLDRVVPHRASHHGMRAIGRLLRVPPGRWKSTFETHGNCVAASVPLTLHLAVEQRELVRGDRCLLLGTGAGFSCGAVVFVY